ncbi:methylated-DNA--[protein]-cysteine S-methyltransferase [Microlunatus speluncae]|uniref:methylated-DNA--[protein]-cysteine S-methyltransferase n=1 Tax=Microlunatus speluncae TaxID=2594267 RepID=UPI0012668861|nr:methylated-DNA--[protein]-cysteine S-methyltransferase [Microlunatus speluncae]
MTDRPGGRTVIDSPIGPLLLESNGRALTLIRFDGEFEPEDRLAPGAVPTDPVLAAAVAQLRDYFAGRLQVFDLPLEPAGSAFQREVWTALGEIGYGETISYGELALRTGRTTTASRAVGLANGANPIPVVIPCHRVIGANGTLVGYGGGLDRKRQLLGLEAEHAVTAQDRLL